MGDILFCWNDQATWAPLLNKPESALQTPETALAVLLESYAGLKVFHACRTVDVNTYLLEGLRPRMIAELNEAARYIAHEFDATVLDSDLDRAIAEVPFSIEGNVYASVDRRELQGHVHFFRYGSERVYLILKRLGDLNGRDYLQQLGAVGRPIMLELAIPWQDVSQWLQGELANAVTQSWNDVRGGGGPEVRRWTHAQDKAILPAAIVAYYEVST
ncbi:hypothetical protein [Lysobacter sp. M15]|uniref:hypothetical protein n=1 Tax=Lysobacter sp. M15 TaxID=2916837 RepID=UPI001F57CEEC|nr:hypothetical protein [Lysobacter sp. M15]